MAQFLEVPQLVDHHCVAEVQVGGGWIEPELDAQRPPGGEFLREFGLDDHLVGATFDQF